MATAALPSRADENQLKFDVENRMIAYPAGAGDLCNRPNRLLCADTVDKVFFREVREILGPSAGSSRIWLGKVKIAGCLPAPFLGTLIGSVDTILEINHHLRKIQCCHISTLSIVSASW